MILKGYELFTVLELDKNKEEQKAPKHLKKKENSLFSIIPKELKDDQQLNPVKITINSVFQCLEEDLGPLAGAICTKDAVAASKPTTLFEQKEGNHYFYFSYGIGSSSKRKMFFSGLMAIS